MVWTLFFGALKLILGAVALLYVIRVLFTIRTESSHFHFRFDRRDSVHSTQQLLVWLGL